MISERSYPLPRPSALVPETWAYPVAAVNVGRLGFATYVIVGYAGSPELAEKAQGFLL